MKLSNFPLIHYFGVIITVQLTLSNFQNENMQLERVNYFDDTRRYVPKKSYFYKQKGKVLK